MLVITSNYTKKSTKIYNAHAVSQALSMNRRRWSIT